MREIGLKVEAPMSMLMDNQAAIRQLETEGSMSSVKHVDVSMKFICDYARKDIVKPKFEESCMMRADLLTIAGAKDCRTTKAIQFTVEIVCGRACDDRGEVLKKMQGDESVLKFGQPLSAGRCSLNG